MDKLYKNAGFESVTHPGYVPKIRRKQRKSSNRPQILCLDEEKMYSTSKTKENRAPGKMSPRCGEILRGNVV